MIVLVDGDKDWWNALTGKAMGGVAGPRFVSGVWLWQVECRGGFGCRTVVTDRQRLVRGQHVTEWAQIHQQMGEK